MTDELRVRRRTVSTHVPREYGYESKIHERIIRRRQSMNLTNRLAFLAEDVGECTFFDQLLIIGARPSEEFIEAAVPEILVMYPASPLLFSAEDYVAIPSFCFPKGFTPTDRESVKKEAITSQFVFQVGSSDGKRKYFGVCTTFSLIERPDAFFYNHASKRYPTCLCMLTSCPNLSCQFTYETFLTRLFLGKLRGYKKRDVELPPTEEDIELLPGMVNAKGAQKLTCFKVPNLFLEEMTFVGRIKAAHDTEVELPLAEGKKVKIPTIPMAMRSIAYGGMDALFTALSVDNIIKCLSMILLEKQIVFLGEDQHILSMSVLCLRELLAPFKYQGTFLPIVPNSDQYLNVLESPVPFILGIVKTEQPRVIPEYVAVVDMGTGEVTDPDDVPLVPKWKKVKKKLVKLLQKQSKDILLPVPKSGVVDPSPSSPYVTFVVKHLTSSAAPNPYLISPKKYIFGRDLVNEILDLFRGMLAPQVEKVIAPCFVSDTTDIENPVTIFNRELFLDSVGKKARAFFSEFVNTTMFQEFCDGKTDEKEKILSQHMSVLSQSAAMLGASTFDPNAIPIPVYDEDE